MAALARSVIMRRMETMTTSPNTDERSDILPAADEPIDRHPLALPGASLTFRDLGFSVPLPDGGRKTILEPCSGHFEPGQLVALMGPSGCGKSTLLDMLAAKKTAAYTGEVLVNGHSRNDRLFRRIAAYVPQEDVMPAHWTVREAVSFNAELKRQPGMKTRGLSEILLEAFGLSGVAGSYIGGPQVRGISGGQRRRVTLARGVAAQAPLLFCDEPTSGLSATDAETCIRALRVVAKRLNVLVVVVIHQPRVEVAALFDTLLMLTSQPGRMAFTGSMREAVNFLRDCRHPVPRHANPTDFFLDRLTPGTALDASASLVESFRARQKPLIDERVARAYAEKGLDIAQLLQATQAQALRAQMDAHPLRLAVGTSPEVADKAPYTVGRYAAPVGRQIVQLLRRKLAVTFRNPLAVAMTIGLPVVQGVVVGCMFQGFGSKGISDQVTFLFILLTLLCMSGMNGIPILIDERTVMKYDTSEGLYSAGAWAFASLAVDVPLSLLGGALNIVLLYVFAGLGQEYFGLVFGWAILLFFVYDSLYACVAAFAGDVQQAQAVAVPFTSIFMLFSGFAITKASSPAFLRWVFAISPNAYALEAVTARLAETLPDGETFLVANGMSAHPDNHGIVVMVAAIIILRALQLVGLNFLHNIQK